MKHGFLFAALISLPLVSLLALAGENATPLQDKSLVAWVAPANLDQRGGSVLTLAEGTENFDGIVFGEIAPARWMAGSDHWKRTAKQPEDRLDPDGVFYKNERQRDFRDPYVLWMEPEQQYWMVLCANALKGGGPGLYVSKDLKSWTPDGALKAPPQECPDLFKIGDIWYLIGGDTYHWCRDPRRIELDTTRPITLQVFVQGTMFECFINDAYALSFRGYDYKDGKLGLNVTGGKANMLDLKIKTHADGK